MNCPTCGKEMEAGYLQGSAPLLWSAEKKRFLVARENDVKIFDGAFPDAHICKTCRKMIVDY